MFTITIGRRPKTVTVAAPVSAEPKAPKRAKGAWKADPISPKQIGTMARMFRQLQLVETVGDTEIVRFAGRVFQYNPGGVRHDGKLGVWIGMDSLTKGEAGDLLDQLFSMPKPGFSPVSTTAAEPVSAPKAEPQPQLKRGDVVTIDGVEYRISGKAR